MRRCSQSIITRCVSFLNGGQVLVGSGRLGTLLAVAGYTGLVVVDLAVLLVGRGVAAVLYLGLGVTR